MSEAADTSQTATDAQHTANADAATATSTWDELFAGEDPAKVKEQLTHARTWETRAKENYDKAQQFDALAEGSKTTEQRLTERIAALEAENKETKAENQQAKTSEARARIAREFKLSDDDVKAFLTSSDEAEMTAVAKRLAARDAENKKNGNHVAREGTTPPDSKPSEDREFVRGLFGGD